MHDLASLPENQQTALLAMVKGDSFKAAAKAAGVDVATLYRWRHHDESFKEAYRAACSEAFGDGLAMLKAKVIRAVEVLSMAMDSSSVSPRRVHAANSILRHAIKATELLEIAERQREIERFMSELEQRRDRGNGRPD